MNATGKWLFVSDVDDTLLGDEAALERLNRALDQAASHMMLVYNSSRPCASLRASLAEQPHLRTPEYLIGALGTEIEHGPTGKPVLAFRRRLEDGWERERVHALVTEMGLPAHPAQYQTALKASYHVSGAEIVAEVRRRLEAAHLQARFIFSGGVNLDIIPAKAGKGAVLDLLHPWLGIPASRVIVAGDSGNDLDMFHGEFRGIVVANASADLKSLSGDLIYHAHAAHAAGVLEGLVYWGVVAR